MRAGLVLELQQAPRAVSFLQDLMPLLACCTVEARHYGLVRLVREPSRGLMWIACVGLGTWLAAPHGLMCNGAAWLAGERMSMPGLTMQHLNLARHPSCSHMPAPACSLRLCRS